MPSVKEILSSEQFVFSVCLFFEFEETGLFKKYELGKSMRGSNILAYSDFWLQLSVCIGLTKQTTAGSAISLLVALAIVCALWCKIQGSANKLQLA